MKKVLLIPLLFISSALLSQTSYLIPYRDGNLWGYADTNMKIVVKPTYDESDIYWFGFAVVRKGSFLGLLDAKGNEIVKPQYESVNERFGNYLVLTKNNKKGIFYLKSGKILLPLLYRSINDIGNNTFIVTNASQKQGIFNASINKWLLAAAYNNISAFAYNTFMVGTAAHNNKGIFNIATKKWLLSPQYEDISTHNFSGPGGKYYIAKKKNYATRFSISENGSISIIKTFKIIPQEIQKQDTLISNAELEIIEEIRSDETNGNIAWGTGEYKAGNKIGYYKWTENNGIRMADSIPAIFESIRWAGGKEDLLIVRKDGKEGVITMRNKEVIAIIYDNISLLSGIDDLLIVKKDGKEGIITKNNQEWMPFIYDDIKAVDSTVSHGIYIVKLDGKYGLAQKDKLLLKCDYDSIFKNVNDLEGFTLMQNGKQGIFICNKLQTLNQILIKPKYDYILGLRILQPTNFVRPDNYNHEFTNEKYILYVSKNGKRGFVDLKGNEFFRD